MNKKILIRMLEILPGFLTWMSFIVPIILTFLAPFVISIFILIYAVYWLLKTIIMSSHLIQGYISYRQAIKIDWLKRLKKDFANEEWQKLYHLVIIATYKEELPILNSSFRALINSNYPLDRLIVVLATEGRDKIIGPANAKIIQKEFGHKFYRFFTTIHPPDLPGEIIGKGPNITFAAREVKHYIDQEKIPYENIITTSLDADHRVDPQYFANLTHTFLSTPDNLHKSFQPLPLFFNNIWYTQFPMRLIAMGSTFWQMVEATRPQRLRNFASHAQSFAALVKTDFWSVHTIVEDGHQYWRSFFTFHGQYSVIPMFVPIYQDAVLAHTFRETLRQQYLQKRRWAWGASDIPYAIYHAIYDKKAPFIEKWVQIFRLIEGHYSWATTSIVLAFVGWLPIIFNSSYRASVLAYNFPYFYSRILTAAMIGMFVTLAIATILLPPPPRRFPIFHIILEWVLTPFIMPITNVIFGCFPAIDSQTRLMFGRYLEVFHVTTKKPIENQ